MYDAGERHDMKHGRGQSTAKKHVCNNSQERTKRISLFEFEARLFFLKEFFSNLNCYSTLMILVNPI